MTAALLERTAGPTCDPTGAAPLMTAGRLLNHSVRVETDRPLPEAAEQLLVGLNQQWDLSQQRGDLHRLSSYPGVMLRVSEPTLVLLGNALDTLPMSGPAEQNFVVLDRRHGRAGVGPATADLLTRLIPDTAAGLIARLCRTAGIRTGRVQVGTAVRILG